MIPEIELCNEYGSRYGSQELQQEKGKRDITILYWSVHGISSRFRTSHLAKHHYIAHILALNPPLAYASTCSTSSSPSLHSLHYPPGTDLTFYLWAAFIYS